ncbi:MAG: cytochrome d ubiquinol oxidase subunit II [Caldimonas sp.]
MDLPLLSAFFVALSLSLYVLLDGFDLGVGALLLIQPDERLRDRMVDAIMPTWDGNETWLIMAGVALLAAFPIAYGVLLPAFYLPLIVMLLSLGLRGVSFEFRYQVTRGRRFWDFAFGLGSLLAALMQGIVVGGLVQGITVSEGGFAGSVYDTFHLFSALTGIAVLVGYCVLGAGWLHLKGTPEVRAFAVRLLRRATPAFIVLSALVCVTAAEVQPGIRDAWAAHYVALSVLSALFMLVAAALLRAVAQTSDWLPFGMGIVLFLLAVAGLAIAVFPNIVPFRVSLWAASSPAMSQTFMLIGAAVVTPMVLGYSAFAYRVFRGKTPDEGWET